MKVQLIWTAVWMLMDMTIRVVEGKDGGAMREKYTDI